MRELRRLLGLNAGRPLEFCVGENKFLISHSVMGENGEEAILVENLETREVLVSDKWSEIAYFVANNNDLFYRLVLTMVAMSFLKQKVPNEAARDDLYSALHRLAEEEPLLKKLMNLS
ncbi:MAG: hypothetical protein UV37_C0004G0042 [Candidatus Collierbacteria bacterium GW2011_GWA1_42_60]|uniref:Uncharacterized protein n=1 Tax=Candidatus Collierbacteria bacterium GW2011_GWA2_42_17 TaxID=1618378 RepID=A0A0G1BAV9_9BACT|nr:MAG: hypothetical protein UU94_C0001G0009 [Candidatus Collierbacteria bacterium GW2011_GWB2_42_12]KKS43491.1 MAG: hypothetical protein UV06_C0001G0225 [Candidatus Collierbacteria bacterium GW2011_GWA2_42_17]KKS62510.1 MAG: hypothetical protein UV28_C0010G0069 [Candidatus Collierbacteria bacterium GW2011_GWE2_42_48]KKS62626.1 MAG: hypothetical protein UV30_C0013G0010 [Candidatus Collierbacteria bacterium GW2011_GWF1_42_50]KKS62791.1 MAG: hypothetical protein UV29_C0010G0026 [Candidatus Collie